MYPPAKPAAPPIAAPIPALPAIAPINAPPAAPIAPPLTTRCWVGFISEHPPNHTVIRKRRAVVKRLIPLFSVIEFFLLALVTLYRASYSSQRPRVAPLGTAIATSRTA